MNGFSVGAFSPCGIVPRGLYNSDNYCFLNVTLQSLLSCKEFVYFLSEMKKAAISKTEYPYLAKFTRFYKQFKDWNKQSKFGAAFTPTFFYDTINEFNPIATTWQEDAQEYLCFLLDKLSLEIRKAAPRIKAQSITENGEWMAKTGGRSRNAILLNDGEEFEPSHITDIFGGAFRSTVLKKGLQSSSRVEPFYCIHLDIRDSNINNLNAAMEKLTEKEKIEGYQDKGTEVQASKQLKIERTPNNLLLHLKRFDYDKNTFLPIKINKPLLYPKIFTLQPSWLSDPKKTAKYQLYCVISHLGVQTQGGHYTCDLYHDLQEEWLHFDDSRVSIIEDQDTVLNNWNAYLLYYRKIE
uniref:ubiquitinyl hydrolase 1 n=1 Tax=Arcella intermedia TaxID=1963864 RepID=A0A6B2L6N2_9EUKA